MEHKINTNILKLRKQWENDQQSYRRNSNRIKTFIDIFQNEIQLSKQQNTKNNFYYPQQESERVQSKDFQIKNYNQAQTYQLFSNNQCNNSINSFRSDRISNDNIQEQLKQYKFIHFRPFLNVNIHSDAVEEEMESDCHLMMNQNSKKKQN